VAGPQIQWDLGTAYDLFLSLYVLTYPEKTGLRASWAAGVRSRLAPDDRRTLESSARIFHAPIHWVNTLPVPKDCAAALRELRRLPAADRLPALAFDASTSAEQVDFLMNLRDRGAWNEKDLERLQKLWDDRKHANKRQDLETTLDGWAHAAEFGERYLSALSAYYQSFFLEEETNILPYLQSALESARLQAQDLAPAELIERLSQGVQVPGFLRMEELVFAPSYWMTPLIFMAKLSPQRQLIVFGARPADASLIPGEIVPDMLLTALKALADPTRLRILRYLAQEPLAPSELARRLRLRPPTVIHHLNAQRLAGLDSIVITDPDDRRYTARLDGVQQLPDLLGDFLAGTKS